ncbi:hypothetical protein Scep_003004 [Stephania cephalantha]|uniref:Uncharacterized protein n=1 Tax=Stephania cephalantha TaxID=152367 RepID=A0AAP0Q5I5_9MAGN
MKLCTSTIEKLIKGWAGDTACHEVETLAHLQKFSVPSGKGSIKSTEKEKKNRGTGGRNTSILRPCLDSSSEIQSLNHHLFSESSLWFLRRQGSLFSNVISASDDGTVAIYDADPFVHLKSVRVHKKGINDLGVHPSGRLALTVGRDSCLAMVNLVRGRRSFCCRLDKEAEIVRFSVDGERFFMVKEEKVSVHESEDARLVFEMENHKRVLCAANASNALLITGGEDRSITAWDTTSGKVAYRLEDAHSNRVKGIVVLSNGGDDNDDVSGPSLVASASSDGVIRVWDMRMARKEKPNALVEANTKARLTCLAGSSLKTLKRLRVGDDKPNAEQDGKS